MRARLALVAVVFAAGVSVAAASLAASGSTASTVVLGSAAFAGQGGEGWGTSRPTRIFNGGDPSGLVKEIQWASWGGSTAIGYGLTFIFKPHGGYYSEPVLVVLRASGLGKCTAKGPRAYAHLSVRNPERPEGSLGPWSSWSGTKSLCKFGFGA
jgi:hypothetical protein